MSAQHTPGPLKIWAHGQTTHLGGFISIGRADMEQGPTAYVATEADATLYTAAPDLLENAAAARDTMGRAADIMEHVCGRRDDAERLRRGVDICRALIAQATAQGAEARRAETPSGSVHENEHD